MVRNEDQSPRVVKDTKPALRGMWERVFQWKAQERCSKRNSCSFSHDPFLASGNKVVVRDKEDARLLPHPMQRQERKKNTPEIRLKFHADPNSVKIRLVDSGILLCV